MINIKDKYKELFGPVIHKFAFSLDQYINYFDDGETTFLFLTRAGERIKRIYDIYKANDSRDNHHLFYSSRFLVAKSYLASHKDIVKEVLLGEYRYATVEDFIKGVVRFDESVSYQGFNDEAYKEIKATEFISSFDSDMHKDLCSYLKTEGAKYTSYFNSLIGNSKRVVLIDSGWGGTIQKLLSQIFPNIEFYGLYFGKIIGNNPHWPTLQKMKGLMFEISSPDKFNYVSELDSESVFNVHRHLIEDLFEPSYQTVEFIDSDIEITRKKMIDKSDDCFDGVIEYFSEQRDRGSILDIYQRSDQAMRILKEMILYPNCFSDIKILGEFKRSFDFGKEGSIGVLIEPKERKGGDSKRSRIKDAIWSQGQIYLEYQDLSKELIRYKQKQNLELIELCEPKEVQDIERSKVAIITRTMDREVLLIRAKESVENQTNKDYTWVIVNDAGDIEPVIRVAAESCIDPLKIIIVNNLLNIGMEAASNRAISMIDSEYINIHDDDDSWDPSFLDKAVAFLESSTGRKYDAVITDTMYVSESIANNKYTIHETRPYNDWITNVHITEMAHGNMFAPICFLFKRSIYNKIGGFDESLPVLGDWNFNLEYLLHGEIGVIKEPLAYYYHRDRDQDKNSAYSNSVIGGMSKHMEYASIVKNRFIRKYPNYLGLIISNGYVHQDVRGNLGSITNAIKNVEQSLLNSINNLSPRLNGVVIKELKKELQDSIGYIHNDIKKYTLEK